MNRTPSYFGLRTTPYHVQYNADSGIFVNYVNSYHFNELITSFEATLSSAKATLLCTIMDNERTRPNQHPAMYALRALLATAVVATFTSRIVPNLPSSIHQTFLSIELLFLDGMGCIYVGLSVVRAFGQLFGRVGWRWWGATFIPRSE